MLNADARQLANLGRALRKAQPDLVKATQKGLRQVGQTVAARAAANASWSKRIPGSMKVRAAGLNSIVVSAGGPSAPHAKPVENHGKGHVRHPVFGDRQVWTDKNSHDAFLLPAAMVDLDGSAEAVAKALLVQVEGVLNGHTGFVDGPRSTTPAAPRHRDQHGRYIKGA